MNPNEQARLKYLRVFADFASMALNLDLLKVERVVAWADAMILNTKIPPEWLIDLSIVDVTDPLAVASALRSVPGLPDHDEAARLLGALVLREWRAGRSSIGHVRGFAWTLYTEDYQELADWGVRMDTQCSLVEDTFGEEKQMRKIIDRELAQFEPHLQRLPAWA